MAQQNKKFDCYGFVNLQTKQKHTWSDEFKFNLALWSEPVTSFPNSTIPAKTMKEQ